MEGREVMVEEITQAMAKGTGDDEVGVDRRTQGPIHQDNQRLTQTLSEAVTPSQYHRTEFRKYNSIAEG
jgi:hypothetical protein